MKRADKIGIAASLTSGLTALAVLTDTDNGRMAQRGVFWQFCAAVMFLYAGLKGSRWWFPAPVLVVSFWVVAAHIPALWH